MNDSPNAEQASHWNDTEAAHWVEHDRDYDVMLRPLGDRTLAAAAIQPGDSVLDIGCGCGNTTIAAARSASPGGSALGVDLSVSMSALARSRAASERVDAAFEVADAQVHPFPDRAYDVAISRFGVMFFDDPVAAFTNIGRALQPAGRLAFVCWQDLAANDWMLVPGAALAAHVALPDLGAPGAPGAPGPFSLADPTRVTEILGAADFAEITVAELRESLLLGGGPTVDGTVAFLRETGMGQTVLSGAAPDAVERAVAAVRDALKPFATADGIRLDGAAWLVTAQRPPT